MLRHILYSMFHVCVCVCVLAVHSCMVAGGAVSLRILQLLQRLSGAFSGSANCGRSLFLAFVVITNLARWLAPVFDGRSRGWHPKWARQVGGSGSGGCYFGSWTYLRDGKIARTLGLRLSTAASPRGLGLHSDRATEAQLWAKTKSIRYAARPSLRNKITARRAHGLGSDFLCI